MRLPRTAAWRRFTLTGRERPDLETIPEILHRNRFGGDGKEGFGSGHRVESRSGWVAFDNLLDRELTAARVVHGGRVLFGLRIDRKKISPALARARVDIEIREQLAQSGRARLSRKELAEIKEVVHDELLAEARPSSTHIPVLWNVAAGTLYFFSNSETASLEFRSAFRSTFGVDLAVVDPRSLVRTLGPEHSLTRLEHLQSARFDRPEVSSPQEEGWSDHGLDDFMANRILGREFLTWLWIESEQCPERLGLLVTEAIDLDEDEVDGMKTGLRRGFPSRSLEARAALLAGKKVASARMVLARDDNEWTLTWKAQTLALSGVRLPRSASVDFQDRILDWIDSVEELSRLLDEIFSEFLAHRLGSGWNDRVGEMRGWVEDGRQQFLPTSAVELTAGVV